MHVKSLLLGGAAALGLAACANVGAADKPPSDRPPADKAAGEAAPSALGPTPAPFASTYARRTGPSLLLQGATVIDGQGGEFPNADVLIVDGKIAGVGSGLTAPTGAEVISAAGKFVTPGIIDAHSHLGVYPSPGLQASSDGNEATQPNTAEVWAEHSVWPQDPGFQRAVAGGVTAMHLLPGSANLFGGRGVTVRPVLGARSMQEMKFPDAPHSLKMACGENPSRVYGGRNSSPSTDMGNVAGWRQSFAKADAYRRKFREHAAKLAKLKPDEVPPSPPERDLELETLAGVLDGQILVQWHCYRAEQMINALDIATEFNFKISAFHHGVEAYKIAPELAKAGVCGALWADWWGFKLESYDGVRENIPIVHAAGGCAIVHSDDPVGIQRLNQEAAKALSDGRRAGLDISRADAWRWLSLNPAKAIGIDQVTGSLKVGKAADVVVWSADPFSVYAVAERVYIDGALAHEREARTAPPSDFELGQTWVERAQ